MINLELKKGMWVITNDRMKLGQIKDFCTCDMCKERGFYEPIINNHIYITNYDKSRGFHGYKFYDNLIDLVKEGDYVNGERINFITNKRELLTDGGYNILKKYNSITSIVTKEQFNSCKYVVERDTNENI